MAQKTRSQLGTQSNNTFKDTPPANIIPLNHRTYNNDIVDSVANLLDDNTFNGVNTFSNLVINKIATTVASASSVDLSAIDGNLVTIQGNNDIDEFLGNEGQIVYIKFVDSLILNAQNGASVLPPYNIQVNNGDVLIAVFENSNQIQILGEWRQDGQHYFELADIAAYLVLKNAAAFQAGALYYIPSSYEYPVDYFWDVLVRAQSSSMLDKNAWIRRNGGWICVNNPNDTLDVGTLAISSQTDYPDEITLPIADANDSQPQWLGGSNAYVVCDGEAKVGGTARMRMFFDVSYNVSKRNILNINDSTFGFMGHIAYSNAYNRPQFFAYHGDNDAWGACVPFFPNLPIALEMGFDGTDITTLNSQYSNSIVNTIIHSATYSVVNDLVTINVKLETSAKFDGGISSHEMNLYFPLPFINKTIGGTNNGGGHGALRFDAAANHHNIGVIVEWYDQWVCLVSAKWSATLSADTPVTLAFSFSYLTEPTA